MESARLENFWGTVSVVSSENEYDQHLRSDDSISLELNLEREIANDGVHAVQRDYENFKIRFSTVIDSIQDSIHFDPSLANGRSLHTIPPFSGDLLRLKRRSRSRVLSSWSKRRFCLDFVSHELWYFKWGKKPKGNTGDTTKRRTH